MPPAVLIVPLRPEHAEACEHLFRLVFDPDVPRQQCEQCLLAEHYRAHLQVFPEGQFAALDAVSGHLLGVSTALRKRFDPLHPHLEPWWISIGQGWLTTHDPAGDWLYGVESIVHPDERGRGIGRELMNARKDYVTRHNLSGIVAASIPRDFFRTPPDMSIEAYVADVVAGRLWDSNLSKHLRMGFRPLLPIPDYVIDREPRRFGILIVWDNPARIDP